MEFEWAIRNSDREVIKHAKAESNIFCRIFGYADRDAARNDVKMAYENENSAKGYSETSEKAIRRCRNTLHGNPHAVRDHERFWSWVLDPAQCYQPHDACDNVAHGTDNGGQTQQVGQSGSMINEFTIRTSDWMPNDANFFHLQLEYDANKASTRHHICWQCFLQTHYKTGCHIEEDCSISSKIVQVMQNSDEGDLKYEGAFRSPTQSKDVGSPCEDEGDVASPDMKNGHKTGIAAH